MPYTWNRLSVEDIKLSWPVYGNIWKKILSTLKTLNGRWERCQSNTLTQPLLREPFRQSGVWGRKSFLDKTQQWQFHFKMSTRVTKHEYTWKWSEETESNHDIIFAGIKQKWLGVGYFLECLFQSKRSFQRPFDGFCVKPRPKPILRIQSINLLCYTTSKLEFIPTIMRRFLKHNLKVFYKAWKQKNIVNHFVISWLRWWPMRDLNLHCRKEKKKMLSWLNVWTFFNI